MSGQPNRKPQDVDNYRQDYMNQLNLRASIDDVNYQANKVYKATGALPPQSSMPDTRSTSEILADVARLKIELIAEFKPLLNPQSAALLIQRIEQSPLNGDGSLIVFLAQNAKQIVPKLQMRYAKGIKGDEGDIETLKSFIENLYSELKDSTGSIKSFFDRPQSTASINLGDFVELIRQYDKIRLQLLAKYPESIPSRTGGTRIRRAFNRILEIFTKLDLLINDGQGQPLSRDMISDYIAGLLISNSLDDGGLFAGGPTSKRPTEFLIRRAQLLDDFITSLPNPSQLRALISQLSKSLQNSDNSLTYNILKNIEGILPNMLDAMTEAELEDLVVDIKKKNYSLLESSNVNRSLVSALQGGLPTPPLEQPPSPLQQPTEPPSGTAVTDLSNELTQIFMSIAQGISDPLTAVQKLKQQFLLAVRQFNTVNPTTELGRLTFDGPNGKEVSATEVHKLVDDFNIATANRKYYLELNNQLNDRGLSLPERQQGTLDASEQIFDGIKASIQRAGVIGMGFSIKGRRRVKGTGIATPKKFLIDKVDHTKGIKPDKKYIPFGKYYIHSHKLNDNILSFRQPSGVSVIGQPAHRVSDKLGNIIRSIVGGKVPSFNDLNGLTEEEKNYLYKVSKKADIADKLSIPTPCKDAMSKDIHDFEVMKGEIMAGNDSKELIKKFKLLLLKLSKNGTLPKVDVQEIMEELLTLGF